MQNTLGQQPISRSGSARSFNTTFGRGVSTPSPRPPRAQFNQPLGPQSLGPPSPSPQSRQQQEFLRQQAEYRARQAEAERQQQLAAQAAAQAAAAQQQQQQSLSVKDTVRDIIANTDFSNFDVRPRSPGAGRRVIQVRNKS